MFLFHQGESRARTMFKGAKTMLEHRSATANKLVLNCESQNGYTAEVFCVSQLHLEEGGYPGNGLSVQVEPVEAKVVPLRGIVASVQYHV